MTLREPLVEPSPGADIPAGTALPNPAAAPGGTRQPAFGQGEATAPADAPAPTRPGTDRPQGDAVRPVVASTVGTEDGSARLSPEAALLPLPPGGKAEGAEDQRAKTAPLEASAGGSPTAHPKADPVPVANAAAAPTDRHDTGFAARTPALDGPLSGLTMAAGFAADPGLSAVARSGPAEAAAVSPTAASVFAQMVARTDAVPTAVRPTAPAARDVAKATADPQLEADPVALASGPEIAAPGSEPVADMRAGNPARLAASFPPSQTVLPTEGAAAAAADRAPQQEAPVEDAAEPARHSEPAIVAGPQGGPAEPTAASGQDPNRGVGADPTAPVGQASPIGASQTAPQPPAPHADRAIPLATLPESVPAQILRAADAGAPMTEIRLSPEELGSVRIELRTEGDRAHVVVSAERSDTLELLRRHADRLLGEFRSAGFSQLDLGFGQWSGSDRGFAGAQASAAAPVPPDTRDPAESAPYAAPPRTPHKPATGLYLRF
ncbi:flagellar hook-length control protein FliK [Rhodobacter sp. Har01]|uniref:flagellar hook-length control protein FliK n=1 Tax=Rhodobacter sp. Har01 TaxID=2883999 RepID=UPI001D07BC65|nr:flagellar hook-length control protein FliK [Rhodobacter sp. Har01]MCB6177959.1 flagellar hook-length control protein FliK [Rhodobacter sp. Har01]